MFSYCVSYTPFVSVEASDVMDRVPLRDYAGDRSFCSTLRAMVFPRMGQEDRLDHDFRNSTLSKRNIDRSPLNAVLSGILGIYDYSDPIRDKILIINVCPDMKEDVEAQMNVVENHLPDYLSGFSRVEKFTAFFRRFFRSLCYENPQSRSTIVFVENLSYRRLHFLQIAIPVMLPWYFPKEKGLSAQEMELIESFQESTQDKYLSALNKMAVSYDFRAARIKNYLGSFEQKFLKKAAETAEENVKKCMDSVHIYEDKISSLMREYYAYSVRLEGLQSKITGGTVDNEMMNYFLGNKGLQIVSVENDTLRFNCSGYVAYFDEEIIKKYLENKSSVLYRNRRNFSAEDVRLLISAIFLDQTLRLKFCAQYELSLYGSGRAIRGANYEALTDCMPNPHLDSYACLGNHAAEINDRLRESDYIGAVEQCVASCMSLNFADSVVIQEFMSSLFRSDDGTERHCIELPDGTMVSAVGALNYLKKQNETGEERNNS